MWRQLAALTLFCIGINFVYAAFDPPLPAKKAVVALLEDNAAELLKHMTNPGNDHGQGIVESTIVFSGTHSIKIVPLQRYHPELPGWHYKITENPNLGEYRYVRFAWKADAAPGIMIQFAFDKQWAIRYCAGQNWHGWDTLFVSPQAPPEWTLVTRDMFKDFGERTITGMALVAFGGKAGYFDHIYLGRTIDDLDRIDVTGLRKGKPIELKADDLDRHWKELASADAAKAYLSFWALVAAPKQAVPFLEKKLAGPKLDLKDIKHWIAELDHAKFIVREKATQKLAVHLEIAADLLEQELEKKPSAEVCLRINDLLAQRKPNAEADRLEKAVRVLEYTATPSAIACLTQVAQDAAKAQVRKAAAAALKRLKKLQQD